MFPRGERPSLRSGDLSPENFNPRSRVGNDNFLFSYDLSMTISIHVPAWGTTGLLTAQKSYKEISIHVPAWGTTACSPYPVVTWLFQSTFPRGERRTVCIRVVTMILFQSTFPRGERLEAVTGQIRRCVFQSTFPRGERQYIWYANGTGGNFNPRSRVGNDVLGISICQDCQDFNPRSRVGNDSCQGGRNMKLYISIHVPAWGTTETFHSVIFAIRISIHVPAWGTTRCREQNSAHRIDFNPRSRVGNDSPARTELEEAKTFQSTFPRGERPQQAQSDTFFQPVFQSTFPRGERRYTCISHVATGHISIHVPAWGTTANFHKYSLLFYAINIIFLLFIIPSLFSLVLFILLF